MTFKAKLIDYLERFIGDLVTRSSQIAELLRELTPKETTLLRAASEREARDAAPGDLPGETEAIAIRLSAWRERWDGLRRWFVSGGRGASQAELLRKSALGAIPRLLQAVSTVLLETEVGRFAGRDYSVVIREV